MDEDRKSIQLQGVERDRALSRCLDRIRQWGLAMPMDVEVLVLDFGLGDFDKTGLIEFWIANEIEAGYCGKFLFLFDGQWCPEHEHRLKHETFYILRGQVLMIAGGEERLMNAGDRLIMPPGVKHKFAGVGPALILELSMSSARGDNFFTDGRIGKRGIL